MSWRALLLVGVALLDGRGAAAADAGLALRVEVGADEVPFGKAFPLTVIREWHRELVPDEFDEEQLAPLVACLEEISRIESDGVVVETQRYRCHAFSLGEVLVAAPWFRARPANGGPERVAAGRDLRLRVVTELDPLAPGPAEPPGPLLPEPVSWARWVAAGMAALALLAVVAWALVRRARRQIDPPPRPPREPPSERLERLRGCRPATAAEIVAFHVDAAALARECVEERCDFRAPERTTEEFVASAEFARALGVEERTLLAGVLMQCDGVKFARMPAGAAERERLLAAAERLVDETREVAAGAAPAQGDGP